MRVLILHNRYRSNSPSGENVVIAEEVEELRRLGHEVETLLPSSSTIHATHDLALTAISATYSAASARALRQLVTTFGPDVVHIHNLYPLLSPGVISVCDRLGMPAGWGYQWVWLLAAGSFARLGRLKQGALDG